MFDELVKSLIARSAHNFAPPYFFVMSVDSCEAPRPKGRGFCLTAVLRARVRNNSLFNKAPLDPALKGGACGEQSGQLPAAKGEIGTQCAYK